MATLAGGVAFRAVRPDLWARHIAVPVLVVHGDKDRLISPAHGQALFQAYASDDKTFISVAGAGHSDLMLTAAPTYAAIATFLLNSLSADVYLSDHRT